MYGNTVPHWYSASQRADVCGCASRRSDAKVAAKQKQVARLELSAKVKEDLKNVALGTSKINYMDPRITVAWCALSVMSPWLAVRAGAFDRMCGQARGRSTLAQQVQGHVFRSTWLFVTAY
jgi:hypothetical protein